MLIFLNTMFNTKTSVKVTPWLNLKKMIFEIYECRATKSYEIEASVGGAYITLDEYVCLFFMNVNVDLLHRKTEVEETLRRRC